MVVRRRWIEVAVGLLLVLGGLAFTIVKLAPCAFAESRAPTESILAGVDRWLEVEEPVPAVEESGTRTIELMVRSVGPGGGPEESFHPEAVSIHDTFFRQIEPALQDGSRVFLAMSSAGLDREMVAYGVSRQVDGTHTFLSGCDLPLTSEARDLLGPRYETAVRRIIGLSGPDAIYLVLAGVEPASDHAFVTYKEEPVELRLFSRTGTLVERGNCLALETDVGPLVPIWDRDSYYLAVDEEGLVVMSGLERAFRPGDVLELAGREMSPAEARSVYSDRAAVRACPGRLILVGDVTGTRAP